MINKIILALLLFVAHLEGFDEVTEDEQHYLEVFFAKYCNETDEEILDKLQKCEAKNPIEIKKIEEECIKTIRSELGKEGVASLMEYKDMECDPVIGKKFEKCMNESLTETKIKELEKQYPPPQLDNIAKEIMYCDCDVYGIKHKKD